MLLPGKLPAAKLAELLANISHHDPRVLAGPAIGRDAAVIDLGGRLLIAKTDPVTFASDHIGWYAVHVNANDIACMGGRPAWFLATVLLPPAADERLPDVIFDQLSSTCDALGVELIGGHTEVTLGLDRPIVCGAMLGEAIPEEIVLGANIQPGDAVLLTKAIAIEGTALLAREAASALRDAGVPDTMIERAARLLFDPGISVVSDAQAIRRATRPRLMHDPTEGGLATALHEMAQAAGMTLRIDLDRVPILTQTRAVSDALGLDPMGLLASGSLLAIVPAASAESAIRELQAEGVPCTRLGSIAQGAATVILGAEDSAIPLPSFARDELARFFDDAKRKLPDE